MERRSGILMHISSLPSEYGIGVFGDNAYRFCDFLADAGVRIWQVLPLNHAASASPYQCWSAFAGDPRFIDPEGLCRDGLLTRSELSSFRLPPGDVNFAAVAENAKKYLSLAYSRFSDKEALERFRQDNDWADDYAIFMTLREKYGCPWQEWQKEHRSIADRGAAYDALSPDAGFFIFQQYEFDRQWSALLRYAHGRGISVFGDMPIYVHMDSADTWGRSELFCLDAEGRATAVAGVPPDYFSETGQLWGFPLYDWAKLAEEGYGWWIRRMGRALSLYDIVRIDHFRAFESYWSVPAEAATAAAGHWEKGPGMAFLSVLKDWFSDPAVVAEDLGLLTDGVRALLADSGFPGMAVLQFAFAPGANSAYLPHNHSQKLTVYTGTHDNDTLSGFCKNAPAGELAFAMDYLNAADVSALPEAMIRAALSSVADTAVTQMSDWLPDARRMNVPGSVSEDNWSWRAREGFMTGELASRIRALNELYGR